MSYGHADKIARIIAARAAVEGEGEPAPAIDPALYHRDDVRPVLAERDIAGLFRVLKGAGLTQRTIAELTGQSPSEVSEILDGRRVIAYDVLVHIAKGLSIPRELMGLSWWGPSDAYPGQVTVVSPPEVSIHLCHERRGELDVGRDPRCDAAWKMEVGPPESPCGGRFQTAYMLR